MWEIELVRDWETIYSDDFQQNWLKWHHECSVFSHVFNHPALGMAWIECYRKLRQIHPLFCIARSKDNLVFLPLVVWKKNWKNSFQTWIIPVGYSEYDYHDPIVTGSGSLDWNQIYCRCLEALHGTQIFDQIHLHGIRQPLEDTGWEKEAEYCPYADLTSLSGMNDIQKSLRGSLRGDLNRQMRKLEQLGPISLHFIRETGGNVLTEILPKFLELHRARWPYAYKAEGFHRLVLEKGLPAGIVDFSELKVEAETISWHLGFKDSDRYYYYMPVINPAYSNYSPGKVHLLYLMNESVNNKQRVFDHLRGSESYKSGWTQQVMPLYAYSEMSAKLSSRIKVTSTRVAKTLWR